MSWVANDEDVRVQSGTECEPCFSADGSELALLDEEGEEASVLGPGAGLVAASELSTQKPVWLVTGVDEAGVEGAAEALDEEALSDAFAVAVGPEGPVSLPVAEEATP